MISLDSPNFLEALMGGAAATTEPTFYVSYAVTDNLKDFDGISNTSGSLNGATPVTLVASPGAAPARHDVRDITIFNIDTQQNTITIRVDVSGGKFNVWIGDVPIGGFARLENDTGRITIYNAMGQEVSTQMSAVVAHDLGGTSHLADTLANLNTKISDATLAPPLVIVTGTPVVANTTAAAYERVVYDPSGGTFQIDAPAGPVLGEKFGVKNATSDTTAITIDGNGNNIEDPLSSFTLAANFLMGSDGVSVQWEYDGTQWLVF